MIEERARAFAEESYGSEWEKSIEANGPYFDLRDLCGAVRVGFLSGAEAMQKAILKRRAFNVPFVADLDPASLLSALEGEQKEAGGE